MQKFIFVLAEVPPTSGLLTLAVDDEVKWRQIFRLSKSVPTSRTAPKRPIPQLSKKIVSQAANYARLIIAACPFQLYVLLVNAVFQLTTHMVTYQLGHERSACLLERHSYYQIEHVSFLVSMGADGDPHLWKTGPSHMVLFVFTRSLYNYVASHWEGFVADLELPSVAQLETETIVSLHPLSPSTGQLNTKDIVKLKGFWLAGPGDYFVQRQSTT
ncbi:hypothetical protein CY34DRAFT_106900 [Suillus luteus UH-Slu-Lm8-n1]|uniref:Uncharacterized protein n=1 Tax=Suillus luteus UH-Slu-Lm8-n1 TaxID=930992 RepID=A0A0D0AKP1_9AGAM|nr:hypothetical protein CY34DRAFT_106900 [Suillus luteus UH-Slu-Lm8-n1]